MKNRRFIVALLAAILAFSMMSGVSAGEMSSIMYFTASDLNGGTLPYAERTEGDTIIITVDAESAVLKTTRNLILKLQRDGFAYVRFESDYAVSIVKLDILDGEMWDDEMILTHNERASSLSFAGKDIAATKKD